MERTADRHRTIFVIYGSRAWAAWCDYRAARGLGLPPKHWSEKHKRYGWFFPTLFPAKGDLEAKPAVHTAAEAESLARLAKLPKGC